MQHVKNGVICLLTIQVLLLCGQILHVRKEGRINIFRLGNDGNDIDSDFNDLPCIDVRVAFGSQANTWLRHDAACLGSWPIQDAY